MEYISGQFWHLKEQRQELVYERGLSYTSLSVQSIDDLLSQIARKSTDALIVDFLHLEGKQENDRLNTMNRWIRFYQSPRCIRHVLEKLNQLLGYRGNSGSL